ncbi:MAG: tRNA (adenine-N1)-methyltransferase [Actinobacteria bacterium]|nr:tRNA (adenine-N1)-methyltransferase [Actinomycetota bacterium]
MDSTGNGAQSQVARGRGDFHYGDRIQLSDSKGKLYSFTLVEGGSWHSHKGIIEHAQCIGLPEGSFVLTSSGTPYFALRPLYEDFVLAMPRGATIVYPKDAADIVGYADIAEGDVVLEAGVGSGALTIALLRAVGPTGVVISTERRDDFATIAEKNLELFFGKRPENWQVRIGSFQEQDFGGVGPNTRSADRVVLDMLAPWECIEAAARALRAGGVFIAYVTTTTQLSRTVEALRVDRRFTEPYSWESLHRSWHVDDLAVRPDNRMIGHTGFLVRSRRVADGVEAPRTRRRGAKNPSETID